MQEIERKISNNLSRIKDQGDCYYFFFGEAKGAEPEDVKVEVNEKQLQVTVSVSNCMWMKYYCDLPRDVNPNEVIANILDSGLEIRIPKLEIKTRSDIPINKLWETKKP